MSEIQNKIIQVLGLEETTLLTCAMGKFTLRQTYYWRPGLRKRPELHFVPIIERLRGSGILVTEISFGDCLESRHYWMEFRASVPNIIAA